MTDHRIVTLLLAAGASSRMGQPKALLPWGDTTVLGHLLGQTAAAGLQDTVLVTGAHHREIVAVSDLDGVLMCLNQGWDAGMGSSLVAGIRYVSDFITGATAILVLLSDQPLISHEYLQEMLKAHLAHPGHIIATAYGTGEGVPALFPRDFWGEMLRISPEKGAKAFIRSRGEDVLLLDAGVAITDMDTPEAYRKALKIAGLNTDLK
ncbi:MAG: nucleotidyltransferase family protein [Robiginitalea sp.]